MTTAATDATLDHAVQVLTTAGAGPDVQVRRGPRGPSVAVFGGRGAYRYVLIRRWAPGPALTWAMLNPSTADALNDDPTIIRCRKRAVLAEWRGRRFGAITVVNLFALRAANPAELYRHPDPIGPGNDACVRALCQPGETVVAAWGGHGAFLDRGCEVAAMLTGAGVELLCLGITASGQPRHPGRLAYSQPLISWRAA